MSDSVKVRVPASSANLGPGFDSFAAALSMYVEVEVVRTGDFAVRTDLEIATDRKNLVVRAFEELLAADEYEFRIDSSIPLSGGMGSSAAAVVAGGICAKRLSGTDADVLDLASGIEGHPDNAAAALYGGFVICRDDAEPVALAVPDRLAAVLVIPHAAVRTAQARKALPAEVPLTDAVANVAGASALAVGIERGDLDLIAGSLADRLHQPYRAGLFPQSAALIERAADYGALGATISGAGPTVLLWCDKDAAADAEARVVHDTRSWADVRRVDFEQAGATLVS